MTSKGCDFISIRCGSGNCVMTEQCNRVMTEQYNPTPFLHIELRGAEN
jgi:hypothetical protein